VRTRLPKRKRPPSEPVVDERERKPSGSGFNAEFLCPGKRAICAKLPKEEDTAAANRGKRIHDALEKGDFSELAESENRTARRIAHGEAELVHEYGFEGALVTFEERIWDVDDKGEALWSGRIDRYDWQRDKRRLLVIDDKTGWGVPPPIAHNWQIRSYGALLSELCDVEETVVALIHPHHPTALWEAKVYNREAMRHLLDVVRANVAEISDPSAPRRPGGEQCRFCPAKIICPEYIAWAAAIDQAIADEVIDQGFTAINKQTPEERGATVTNLKERKANIDTVLERYVHLVERDPDGVAGYRLARRLTRVVTDKDEAMNLVRKEWGEDVLDAAMTFSIPALEAEVAPQFNTKKEANAAVKQLLGALFTYKESKNFLEEARSL
jgi:hypothetical protein